jgi:hypothetical protein
MQSLGMPTWSAGYCIWDEDKKAITCSMSRPFGDIQPSFWAPLDEEPSFIHFLEAYNRGEELFIDELSGKAIEQNYKYLRTLPVVGEQIEAIIKEGHQLPTYQVNHCAYFSKGFLLFITYQQVPEAHDIFKRFASVFDQTYTRFLDLQKAEAQARESQIQLAMERVRARTMAMQHSSELSDTAALLFQQVKSLGVPPWSCGFNIWEQGDTFFTSYMGSPGGAILEGFKIPLTEEATFIHFQESRDRGDKLFIDVLEGEAIETHYQYFQSLPEIKKAFEKRTAAGEHLPTFQINHLANFSHGNLLFITYEPCPEAHDIFIRFAKVFEQTYTRFLDLQKAEAQARESQIQLALERVRARAMAMYHSDELSDVLSVLFEQFDVLGINPNHAILSLVDLEKNSVVFRLTGKAGKRVTAQQVVDLTSMDMWMEMVERWKKDGPDVINLIHYPKEVLPQVWKIFAPVINAIPEDARIKVEDFPDGMYNTEAYCQFGYIGFCHIRFATEEEKNILTRFATEFGRLYQRFLDLQKSEAQARESQIQLALERVRARTMAMQKSEELPETSHILFEQMKELGEPVEQLTIGVVHEENKVIEISATLHGDILKKIYQHSLDEPFMMSKIYHAWKTHQKTLIVELKGDELNAYNKYRNELTKSEMFPTNLGDEHRRIVYAAFFSKGMLALGANEPRPPESLQLLERFAGVFDQAYIRFIDLKNAEAQAREAQIETALERVRSRTMAMHQTSELQEVIHTVHKELLNLNLSIDGGSFVVINDDVGPELRCWGSGGTANTSEEVQVPHFNMPFCTDLMKGIKRGPGFFTEEFSQKEKIEYFTKLFEHKPWSDISSEQKEETLSSMDGYTRSVAVSKHTSIFIINHHGRKFTAAENDILKRFAKVFEQTYTRFLDLQKAEAQARESKIQ